MEGPATEEREGGRLLGQVQAAPQAQDRAPRSRAPLPGRREVGHRKAQGREQPDQREVPAAVAGEPIAEDHGDSHQQQERYGAAVQAEVLLEAEKGGEGGAEAHHRVRAYRPQYGDISLDE